jgi:ABC-2 type transport system permease protein
MMAVFLGGLMIPATSIITEKNKKTINAVLVTPGHHRRCIRCQGSTWPAGVIVHGHTDTVINQAFGTQPLLLVLMVGLGGLMATDWACCWAC